jgi:hypothetical protein
MARPLHVLSIDLGVKNFCYCFLDGVEERIVKWERLSVPQKKGHDLLIPRLVGFLERFRRDNAAMVLDASLVAIEMQMTSSLRIMVRSVACPTASSNGPPPPSTKEAVMYTQYLGKSQSFNARKVKAYWRDKYPDMVPEKLSANLGNRNIEYRLGKKMAVDIAEAKILPLQQGSGLLTFVLVVVSLLRLSTLRRGLARLLPEQREKGRPGRLAASSNLRGPHAAW